MSRDMSRGSQGAAGGVPRRDFGRELRRPDDSPGPVDDATVRKILDGDARQLVDTAERVGQRLAEARLKTSQIRGIFGTVRRIEMGWPRSSKDPAVARQRAAELLMLRPKLAYQAARHRQDGGSVGLLEQTLRPFIDTVGEDRERFQRFVDFFEAILAYHRATGGRDE